MQRFHGSLLIGGMTLRNLAGLLVQDPDAGPARWWGECTVEAEQAEYLETNRPYRLVLDDGRAGQLVVIRVAEQAEDRHHRVLEFKGTSPLR
jgi:hypothetical protein